LSGRKKFLLGSIAVVSLVCAVFHRVILRAAVDGLIVDDPVESCATLVVVNGDRKYAVAAEMFHQGKIQHVLLPKEPPRPLVACGIIEPHELKVRREITELGVPESAVTITDDPTRGIWEIADVVREQLAANPAESRLAVVADLVQTGRLRYVLEESLSKAELARVRIHAIRDRRYDETNWWRTRTGLRDVTLTYLRYLHNGLIGRPEPYTPPEWSPAVFERQLLDRQAQQVAGGARAE
jgi:hypothetical protein